MKLAAYSDQETAVFIERRSEIAVGGSLDGEVRAQDA
jgi:hypothetical protein